MKRFLFYIGICFFILIACEKEDSVTTISNKINLNNIKADTIKYKSAIITTTISNPTNTKITEHGHCWGTNQDPTIIDNKTELGLLINNTFKSELINLEHNTIYYVKSYIQREGEIIYSDSVFSFEYNVSVPNVTINDFLNVTVDYAKVGISVENNTGSEITAKGICWNITGDPTINDNKTIDGLGSENYISELNNLNFGTKYYLRPYAMNEGGTGYGEEKSLTIDWGVIQIQDFDNNWYNTVKVGNQIWLKENLRTTHYPDGTVIPDGTGINVTGTNPEYCFTYDDIESNASVYGRLYTWYTSTQVCPTGWHMATKSDWDYLLSRVYPTEGNLKSIGTIEDGTGLWKSPNIAGIDTLGLNIIPSGFRFQNNDYVSKGESAGYLFPNDKLSGYLFSYDLERYGLIGWGSEYYGFPVRCVKN